MLSRCGCAWGTDCIYYSCWLCIAINRVIWLPHETVNHCQPLTGIILAGIMCSHSDLPYTFIKQPTFFFFFTICIYVMEGWDTWLQTLFIFIRYLCLFTTHFLSFIPLSLSLSFPWLNFLVIWVNKFHHLKVGLLDFVPVNTYRACPYSSKAFVSKQAQLACCQRQYKILTNVCERIEKFETSNCEWLCWWGVISVQEVVWGRRQETARSDSKKEKKKHGMKMGITLESAEFLKHETALCN